MSPSPTGILGFLEYSLDAANARLCRGTDVVALRPKALAVLQHLAEHPGELVTKAELLDAVWTDTAVTDWVLTSSIRELREALGDDARQPRMIETVHRRGYRFIAAIRHDGALLRHDGAARSEPRSVAVAPARPIVGRYAELAVLDDCWRRALTGERQVAFVLGEAGMGKTTLVDEFLRRLGDATPASALLARGQCIEQHGAVEPYLPVLEAFGRLCAEPDGGPLIDALRRHAPAWLAQIPGTLEPAECEALERRLGATPRERMLREMASLVAALQSPLVIVLEDLHWSDHATLDLVSTLARRPDAARLLLVGTYRPVEVALRGHPLRTVHHDLRAHALCRELWLAPLSLSAVQDYLDARWPGLTSAGVLAHIVHEHTDGNPLFLVNIIEYLAMNGAIMEADGGWRLRGDATALAVDIPQELRQLVATQLDRLGEGERTALEVGSLVGRRFSAALVAAALAADVVDVAAGLTRLSHDGLMVGADGVSEWPDGVVAGAYRFNHFLHQSVLRGRIPPARRRQLHERIATRLELAYHDQLAEVSAELAFHFEASGQGERAVPYLEEAATRAARVGAVREARTLLERALAIVDPLPPTPERTLRIIRLSMALGSAIGLGRGFGALQIEQAFERARRLSEASNDVVQLFQALVALTQMYIAQARLDRAQETAQEIERLLPTVAIPPFVFAGNLYMGVVKYHSGDLGESLVLLERAVALQEVPLPPVGMDLPTMALSYATLVLIHQGLPDRGREMLETARRSAAQGRPLGRSLVAQIGCFTSLLLRDMDALASVAVEAAAADELPAFAAVGRFSHGRVLSAGGDLELGLKTMRECLDAYQATGQNIALPLLVATLAEAYAESGDVASAFACVMAARAAALSGHEIRYLAELHRLEGTLHAARGERTLAERCFRDALSVARAQGARWWELRATTSFARMALEQEAPKDSRRAYDRLAAFVGSFREGFDTPDLRDARQLLDHYAAR